MNTLVATVSIDQRPQLARIAFVITTDKTFSSATDFAAHLRALRKARPRSDAAVPRRRRNSLGRNARSELLQKTGGRCHICGGEIGGESWQADHVLAHSAGGKHDLTNYLPAHSLCNNYRWFYGSEEFQWILKLGVWMRTQIERETRIGKQVGQQFVRYERHRSSRRKPGSTERHSSK